MGAVFTTLFRISKYATMAFRSGKSGIHGRHRKSIQDWLGSLKGRDHSKNQV
jgi:hypothetical protein